MWRAGRFANSPLRSVALPSLPENAQADAQGGTQAETQPRARVPNDASADSYLLELRAMNDDTARSFFTNVDQVEHLKMTGPKRDGAYLLAI